jgi:hypothetical protein
MVVDHCDIKRNNQPIDTCTSYIEGVCYLITQEGIWNYEVISANKKWVNKNAR